MWIVRLALARPRTIAVMALLIFILGTLNILKMPKDIFPSIDVPVVAVIWSYGGVAPEEMEARVVRVCEQAITTSVANIEHVESTSLAGTGIIKIYLQPGSSVSAAITQIAATSQSVIASMPQGITPPSIINYDASDVPIVQLTMSSETAPIASIVDVVSNVIRPQLVTIRGAGFSPTLGGLSRLINVDLDPDQMTARGVTAQQVTNAIGREDIILPAGDVKMGPRDYYVKLNNSPSAVRDFNNLPIKVVNGATVFVRDVAHVRNGNGNQISLVRVNGKPAVLLTVLKNGSASTLDVVSRVKERLPLMRSLLPSDVKLDVLLDQSLFVRASVVGVVREAVIAAGLTGLMILLFLGSWRNTLIVAISIPLSILTSIVVLGAMGQTLNTLTLGGMALAVGMLVDDATVVVENTTRNLEENHTLLDAILHSAEQVALPALTSTLSICIVFVPVVFLTGVARSLFMPLALAVVFAMLPSYLLSRTLVTSMMQGLLGKELDLYRPPDPNAPGGGKSSKGLIWRIHEAFEHRFERLRDSYHSVLAWTLNHRRATCMGLGLFFLCSALLLPFIGEDFFPKVDAGQMRLHVRVPPGTRIEATGKMFSEIEDTIRQVIPHQELALILDNIGLAGGSAYVRGTSSTIGSADGEIDISLSEKHHSTWDYMARLRRKLQQTYPNCAFFYQPADMPTQVLDFGTSAPIDIQVFGDFHNRNSNYALAQQIMKKISVIRGITDTYIYQVQNTPEMRLSVDRLKALQANVTQQAAAGNVLVSLSSSSLVAPSYFLDPVSGFEYTVATQTRQYKVDSVDALLATPLSSGTQGQLNTTASGASFTAQSTLEVPGKSTALQSSASAVSSATGSPQPELLSSLASVGRDTTPQIVNTYNTLPVFDVFASVENRDLGGATRDVEQLLKPLQKSAPRGVTIAINGQALTMQSSFVQLGLGLVFAIVLVYLLLTVNFESWIDPLVILMASPGALCGVLWGLFATQSTFNVPSLMGAIMTVGVATANSILLVTFANDRRNAGSSALTAALEAGYTRFRPIIMTALAMILGMLPMAIGLGDGGEQNAPLGRAVIGGLMVATFTTLFFVPIMYTILRRNRHEPETAGSTPQQGAPLQPNLTEDKP